MQRQTIVDAIHAVYRARTDGEKDKLVPLFAPGATYRLVGDPTLVDRFPAAPADAVEALSAIIDIVDFKTFEAVTTLVEGQRAAVHWRVEVSFSKRPSTWVELFDLWTFDDEGLATSLVQFADTAFLKSQLDLDG